MAASPSLPGISPSYAGQEPACGRPLPSRIFPCRTRRHHLPEETAMPSFTTAAKDEILSNKAVRQHFPNQQSFGLMVFSR